MAMRNPVAFKVRTGELKGRMRMRRNKITDSLETGAAIKHPAFQSRLHVDADGDVSVVPL